MVDFAQWIIDNETNSQFSTSTKKTKNLVVNNIEEEISRLLVLMYRYAKVHLKTYLSDFPELIQEDFTYLYALKRVGSLTKTQLIETNVHEKTSGLEVIRRLIAHGLVKESIDKIDKRSKRLVITPKGDKAFWSIKAVTNKVAKLITGKLTKEEKLQFYHILRKLDAFHHPLYLTKDKLELDIALATFSLN